MNILQLFSKFRKEPTAKDYIDFLLDKENDLGGRDDAAMDLYKFDEPEVVIALVKVATDSSEEDIIIDSAGESLREIWNRNGISPPENIINKMNPEAKKFFTNESI